MDTQTTRAVVEKYFSDLARGDLPAALAALSPTIDFELPTNAWNTVIPYLGRHRGLDAVRTAFEVRGETTEVLDYALRDVWADGDTAVAIIYTRAAHTRTRVEFEITDAHVLTVEDARITSWKVYFDPNDEIAAFNADREQRLLAAARDGDAGLATALLRVGARVDARDPDSGLTPLMIAAGRGDAAMARLLLDAGADVHMTDPGAGATALHKACQGGDGDVVRALVEAGAFVDAVVPTTGHTPLHEAVWFSHPELVEYLLGRDAGINLDTHYGFSLQRHFEYELGVNTADGDDLRRSERLFAARREADDAAVERQRLMAAVVEGDAARARELLDEGVDVDERAPVRNGFNDAHTPLLVAARDGHTAIVRMLLDAGADVNAVEPTFGAVPLHKAVYNGHAESTRMIAAHPGVDLDFQGATNGYTPLHDALWHGYEECSAALVEAGATLTLHGHDGKTPLDLATEVFGPEHALTDLIAAKSR